MLQIAFQKRIEKSFLPQFGKDCAKVLSECEGPFYLAYDADVGVGKTTLTAQILYGLGLNPIEPVMSPTFAYVNEYEIGDKLYAHLDLYRIEDTCDITEILGRPLDSFSGLFVEWPSKVDTSQIDWTHRIEGTIINETTREFTLSVW